MTGCHRRRQKRQIATVELPNSRCRDNTHFPHPVHASYAHKPKCQEGAPCEVIPSVIPVGEALEKKWVCSLWKQLHQTPGRRRLKLLNFKSRARLPDRTRRSTDPSTGPCAAHRQRASPPPDVVGSLPAKLGTGSWRALRGPRRRSVRPGGWKPGLGDRNRCIQPVE